MRKLTIATILAAVLLSLAAVPALAASGPEAGSGGGGGDNGYQTNVGAGGGTITAGSYFSDAGKGVPGGNGGGGGGGAGAGGGGSTGSGLATCTPGGGRTQNGMVLPACQNNLVTTGTVTGPANQPAIQPVDIARQLISTKSLPTPDIGMSPPPGDNQLVNIPGGSWLWVNPSMWHAITATAPLPGEFVSVTATPVSVAWNLEDGSGSSHVRCDGPGTPYDPGRPPEGQRTDCSYTFRQASPSDSITAAITWQITWFATGVIDDFGTLPALTTTASTNVRVVQAQSLNSN